MSPGFGNADIYVSALGQDTRIALSWSYTPEFPSLADYDLLILRGESPSSLVAIGPRKPAVLLASYLDSGDNTVDIHKLFHYQLQLHNRVTGEILESPVLTWEGDRDTIGIYVVGEHNFKFRYVSGVPCAVFKKMHDGRVRCECWNPIAKTVTRSNCPTCKNTGWVGGFYEPIYTWVDFSPDASIEQYVDWGEKQPSQLDIMFTDYPRLRPGDMIVEITTDKRWAVVHARDTEKRRRPMLQWARLDQINRSDIEYSAEISETLKVQATSDLNELRRDPLSY